MSTKKQFVEIVTFLKSNKSKKVSEILAKVEELTCAKKSQSNVLYDDKKNVIAIFCYYHKQWELVANVDYGIKQSSASGFNTMCKIGTNAWTKQQAIAKKSKEDLLTRVAQGEVVANDIQHLLENIEATRTKISSKDKPKGTKDMPKLK